MKRQRFEPTPSYHTFLSRLRLARQEVGVSQRELAKRLGIHHSRVNRAEDAKRPLDIIEVRAICQALGLSVVDFTRELDTALGAAPDAAPTGKAAPSTSNEE